MSAYIAAVGALLLVAWVVITSAVLQPEERNYLLKDGRTLHCLVEPSTFGSSISCDWAKASR